MEYPIDKLLSDEEKAVLRDARDKAMMFRRVFGSEQGELVLHQILSILGYFKDVIETPEEIANRNVAVRILKTMGCWEPVHSFQMVRDLTNLELLDIDSK